jgi:hypothetical protein
MKILLDECLPLDFRLSFPQHDAHSAEWAGFKGNEERGIVEIRGGSGVTFYSRSIKRCLSSRTWTH